MYQLSSDKGKTWSCKQYLYDWGITGDDNRYALLPAMYLDANEGFVLCWANDDLNDYMSIEVPIQVQSITGVVKDNAGSAVENAHVKLFSYGLSVGSNTYMPYWGGNFTDASGNYSIGVPKDIFNSGPRHYFAVATNKLTVGPIMADDFNWGAVAASDFTGYYVKSGTAVAHDTTNHEIDFDAGTGTAGSLRSPDPWTRYVGSTQNLSRRGITMRCAIRIDNITAASSSTQSGFYFLIGTTDDPIASATSAFGIRVTCASSTKTWTALAHEGGTSPAHAGVDFARTPIAETLYFQFSLDDKQVVDCAMYSADTFAAGALLETLEVSTTWDASTTLQIENLAISTEAGSADHTLDGALLWWQWYEAQPVANLPAEETTDSVDVTIQEFKGG